jgi:hypothetical protein
MPASSVGLYYLLSKIKSVQDPTKKKDKEKGGSTEKSSNSDTITTLKIMSDTNSILDTLSEEPNNLNSTTTSSSSWKMDTAFVSYEEPNELSQQLETHQGAVLFSGLNISRHQTILHSITRVSNPPSLVMAVSLHSENGPKAEFLELSAYSKRVAAACLLAGVPLCATPSQPIGGRELKVFVKILSGKLKDSLKIGEGNVAGDLQSRRLVYSVPFLNSWGFLQ